MDLTRGDSCAFKVLLKKPDGTKVTLDDISELFVTCRQYANDESPIIFQKTLDDVNIDTDGYCHVKFLPTDTENLAYGNYCFDIEITLTTGYRKTKFYDLNLTKEVTIHLSEEGA